VPVHDRRLAFDDDTIRPHNGPNCPGYSATNNYQTNRRERFGRSVGTIQVRPVVTQTTKASHQLGVAYRVEPTLVKGHLHEDGTLTPAKEPERQRVVSEEAATAVAEMLELVTEPDGVATAADITDYRIAGKTGTAQRVDPSCGCYNGYTTSFVGFAPADEPRYLVYVSVHGPKKGDVSGSATAAPVFRDVMAFTLQKYGVPPTGEPTPEVAQEW
jgi:membrane peptidoglycan carboxypeptidase